MKRSTNIILNAAVCIMILVIIVECIIAITLAFNSGKDSNIDVNIKEGETSIVEFEKLGLIPGESTEYKINLSTEAGTTDCIYINFDETQDSPLKDFVKAKISINGEVICDELLSVLFNADDITYAVDLNSADCEIVIVYYMPLEVGNEAENAEAWFNLLVTAEFQ